jgi:hypothetical protein
VAIAWESASAADRRLVVVNLAAERSAGRVIVPWTDIGRASWLLEDLVGGGSFERDGTAIADDGLYIELPPWGVHWFTWTRA